MADVELQLRDGIALITFGNPPVNTLPNALRAGLAAAFARALADATVRAIVLTGTGRAFSAGADIAEFATGMQPPLLPELIDTIEACPKPVIAALNGLAVGGGLELAMGCHYRVSVAGAQLGLPEVKLGIIPGAGGTQRLPRLVGVEMALEMITSGAPVDARRAKALGLVDEVAEGEVVIGAVAFARELLARGAGPRRTGERAAEPPPGGRAIFAAKRAALKRHPSGPVAPQACVDAIEAAATLPFAAGQRRERELFRHCAASPYAKALQYVFFAERQAAHIPDIEPDVQPRGVARIGIVGAGTMGSGIAAAFLNAGFPVTLVETAQAPLDRGVATIRAALDGAVRRGRATKEQAAERLARLTPTLDMEDLRAADLVIEAVFESMAVKKEVFAALDRIARPGAILATNTSTLDIDAIARATSRPADVLGLHFFSPAHVMRLLEIVRGGQTAKDAMATAMALAKRTGKVGVQARVCFGFIGNRMFEAYLEEVQALLLEGATPADVDAAIEDWGFAMGPNAVMDLAGLDVGYRIRREHRLSEERARLYRAVDRMVEMGRHGQKTGAGYYRYSAERRRERDPEVEALIRAEAEAQGIAQRQVGPEEIVDRCLLRLANEGARVLEEGIALRAGDIDVVYVTGYGFPAWRGGPMWHAEQEGLAAVAERIRAYERRYGTRWALAPLIAQKAGVSKPTKN